MEISFYVLLVLACLVLLLAMWACAGSSTQKWGPDLTLELPPHLLHEAFFGHKEKLSKDPFKMNSTSPSAPSELPCDPLLSNEHQMGRSNPPPRYHRPAPKPPAVVNVQSEVRVNRESNMVRVLPSQYAPAHKLRPIFSTFTTEEPA